MLTFREAQGGGRLQHVEPSWSVGNILSAGPYSGKQVRPSLAAGRPRPIRTEHGISGATSSVVGQLYPATGSATRMVISSSISRAASLERLTLA